MDPPSIHETLFLNPLTKWKKYKIFPYLVACHICLVGLVMVRIPFFSYDMRRNSANLQHFYKMLNQNEQARNTVFTGYSEIQDALFETSKNFLLLDQDSIVNYETENLFLIVTRGNVESSHRIVKDQVFFF